ncbi:protein Shroom3 [Peromyscus californicus insignis]|uniref:protein Shroom3 n=1 Tax=Peromyscus californicus insignis TaxID=564181 RepID=UPI0022A6D4E8|nr:protein Shroom3 [Peromyscus californicus insignis]
MRTPENLEEPSSTPNPGRTPQERFVYLEALLEGGAPWGFTLKGGLEHGEPLIISKIEEGGKADVVSSGLQAGDEVVHINEVALSSSRREAVSLVKGSYKTLRLVVRRDVCADPGRADPGASNSLGSELLTGGPQHRKATWSGGVKLRLKQRCSEPAARPHSWHTTKFGENKPDASMMQISQGTMGPPWHQSYHSSSSTSDLSNYDHAYLRRSPDQCSSQGSMESLEPGGGYPSCHPLSPAKSTSSIDQLGHLHNKRDSAYSSFSTSSSILEYPPPGGSGQERSASTDMISARGGLLEGMRQADIRYVKTVYDTRRGVSSEYEVNPSALLLPGRDAHAPAGIQGCAKWHSVPRGKGAPSPSWSQQCPGSSDAATDNLPPKVGAPTPPTRSDSYAAIRQRERPSSWSSLDQKRFCRPQGNSSGPSKTPFLEEQLHTVLERSPESSPPVRPKHAYAQKAQPGQPLLPTGIYPVPSPEPHFAQVPQPSVSSNGTVYPALVKESGYAAAQGACNNRMAALDENGNHREASRPGFAFCQPPERDSAAPAERNPEPTARFVSYKVHFSSAPGNEDASLKRHVAPLQGNSSPYPSERRIANHQGLSPPRAPAASPVGGDRRPSRLPQPRDGDFQEDHNANPRQKQEREGHSGQSNFGRSKLAFASLQNIPESLRRRSSSVELGGEAQEGSPGGRPPCALYATVEEPGRKAGPDGRSYLDRPASCPRPEGKVQAADPRSAEPPAPPLQQTCGVAPRRPSSSSASPSSPSSSALQYRKTPCSVLEKVSKIEEREQGRHRLPSVGSCTTFGPNARPGRSGSDFEDPKAAGVHLSTEATEQPRNGEAKLEEAPWQPCGQPPRRAAEGRGPPGRAAEPPRPEARLLRSQSTFQLFSEAEREAAAAAAAWSEDRPGTPESPPLDAPFSRAYRNSIKDAQSRVLGATSFRRRDLEPGTPAATSRPWRPRPASAHVGMRSPEAATSAAAAAAAAAAASASASSASSSSPHTPRERHSVTPAAPQAARRGARRRLTPEQKKRSYSEPEKMNEVGVSEEAEPAAPCCGPQRPTAPPPPRFSESTVADRRRLFERDGKACSSLSLSGPELKQFQQSALADYIQRKTGKRPASAACPQEPGLRERAQSAYLQAGPDGPGLASACSLSSLLREPEALHRKEHPHLSAAADAPQAPRDRSSSFASGRLVGERRRWDPQIPRQLLSGGNCGPRGTQRMDRTPGGSPSWDMVAAKAGKSKSAEDLLERSDTLAVPVHVRSRSSPTSDKKGQDVLLREDGSFGFVKDPCCLAGTGSRSISCSDRGQKEPALPLHHPTPCWNGLGYKATVGSSAPAECSGAPDHLKQPRTPCPRPLSAGMQGHFPDARAASVAALSSPLPSPVPSSYHSQLPIDPQTDRSGQTGRQPLPSSAPAATRRHDGHSLTQPPSPKGHEFNGPEHGLEEGMWKRGSPPQRPPPLWVKWAPAVREDGLSEDTSAPELANPKHYRNQSLPSSCSTSDPDTPGRISLRISESALQASPPPRGDYDDEVFVKDLHPKVASSPAFEALPPPPPLPPPPSQETLVNGSDDFPPPPPQAVDERLDSEASPEPVCSSSSRRFPTTTTTVASRSEGSHVTTPKPPQTSATGSEAESSTPSDGNAQPQLASSLGQRPSPSQTQSLVHEPVGRTQDPGKKIQAEPQKTSEDIRTEALAKEIVHQDKSLADILDPDSRMKTTMDLMEGLFPRDASVLTESVTKRKALETAVRHTGCEAKRGDDKEATGVLVNCPAYYSVSAAKAELLNKIKDMPEEVPEEEEEEEQEDVNEKKAELIGSLTHKLETLQEAKGSLLMDIQLNNALGEEVEALISELCKPNEFDKYKMFIGDLDKVVNLLLSLSGRLARVENVLSGLGEDASKEERSSLNEKRKILAGQHEDARELKENLDRRERVVLAILANYLSAKQLQDYQHFVKMKSTLLIEQRKLDDKIKLGQEQVKCLLESLPSDFRPKAGAISLPPALTSHVTPGGGSGLGGIFPALTSPL